MNVLSVITVETTQQDLPRRLWSRSIVSAVRQVGLASLASRRLRKGHGQNSTTSSRKLFYILCLVTIYTKDSACSSVTEQVKTPFLFLAAQGKLFSREPCTFFRDNIQPIRCQNLPAPIPLILHAHSRATVRIRIMSEI